MSIQSAPGDLLAADVERERGLSAGLTGLNGDTFSVIDRHSTFDGTYRSERDVRIEGEVKGTIECKGTLFVAQGANVTAKVEAENITVAGDLNGDIHSRGRLQIMPSGRVRGKVATQTLVVNEGAYYEGQLEMAKPEDRTNQPRSLGAGGPVPMSPAGGDVRGQGGAGSTTFIRRLGGPETPWESRGDEEEAEAGAPRNE
jgi:cytoskeletal protein CcmA (bactofilin family)